jgi:hypothetical protein
MPGYIKPPSNQYIYSSSTVDGARIMTAASDYGFRNKLINGDFSIWQRGTSFNISSNSNTFCADRWQIQSQGGTAVASQQLFSPGTLTGIETPYYLRLVQSAGSANTLILNRLEDVRTLAGQTVTVSYWAKASASTTIITRFDQDFGSGGSSRAANGGSSNTITTSWARYSSTFTVASISGKTIGSSSYIEFFLYYPNTAGITVELAGVQIESGLFATQFEYRPQQIELAMCQRYFESYYSAQNDSALLTGVMYLNNTYIAPMQYSNKRTEPSFSIINPGNFDIVGGGGVKDSSGLTVGFGNQNKKHVQVVVTSSGTPFVVGQAGIFRADLGYEIQISAEI